MPAPHRHAAQAGGDGRRARRRLRLRLGRLRGWERGGRRGWRQRTEATRLFVPSHRPGSGRAGGSRKGAARTLANHTRVPRRRRKVLRQRRRRGALRRAPASLQRASAPPTPLEGRWGRRAGPGLLAWAAAEAPPGGWALLPETLLRNLSMMPMVARSVLGRQDRATRRTVEGNSRWSAATAAAHLHGATAASARRGGCLQNPASAPLHAQCLRFDLVFTGCSALAACWGRESASLPAHFALGGLVGSRVPLSALRRGRHA